MDEETVVCNKEIGIISRDIRVYQAAGSEKVKLALP